MSLVKPIRKLQGNCHVNLYPYLFILVFSVGPESQKLSLVALNLGSVSVSICGLFVTVRDTGAGNIITGSHKSFWSDMLSSLDTGC